MFHFSTSGEKSAKFEDFRRNNCVLKKAIRKNCAFQKISREKKKKTSVKYVRIYSINLNENCAFQKISCEKCVNFADFWPIKRIFTQPITIKG